MLVQGEEGLRSGADIANCVKLLQRVRPQGTEKLCELVIAVFRYPRVDHERVEMWAMFVDGSMYELILKWLTVP
jgi:hypothetical protein